MDGKEGFLSGTGGRRRARRAREKPRTSGRAEKVAAWERGRSGRA